MIGTFILESYLYNKNNTCYTASQKAISTYYTLCYLSNKVPKSKRLNRYIPYDSCVIHNLSKEMRFTILYNEKNKLDMVIRKYQDNQAVYTAIKGAEQSIKGKI